MREPWCEGDLKQWSNHQIILGFCILKITEGAQQLPVNLVVWGLRNEASTETKGRRDCNRKKKHPYMKHVVLILTGAA